MAGQYERLYDSSLLDELHNYFPALLYDSSRFSSVADVISYVQNQTRNRFDLYSYGLNQFRERNPGSSVAHRQPVADPSLNNNRGIPIYTPVPSNRPTGNYFHDTNYTLRYTTPVAAAPPLVREEEEEILAQWADIENIMGGGGRTANTTATLLTSLFSSMLPRVPARASNFMAPVIVRPSEEQIAAGSRLDFVGALTENQCAICQAGFEIGEERRTLSHCDHEFHRACIDPWFQQNVHCPVCRHDIREAND